MSDNVFTGTWREAFAAGLVVPGVRVFELSKTGTLRTSATVEAVIPEPTPMVRFRGVTGVVFNVLWLAEREQNTVVTISLTGCNRAALNRAKEKVAIEEVIASVRNRAVSAVVDGGVFVGTWQQARAAGLLVEGVTFRDTTPFSSHYGSDCRVADRRYCDKNGLNDSVEVVDSVDRRRIIPPSGGHISAIRIDWTESNIAAVRRGAGGLESERSYTLAELRAAGRLVPGLRLRFTAPDRRGRDERVVSEVGDRVWFTSGTNLPFDADEYRFAIVSEPPQGPTAPADYGCGPGNPQCAQHAEFGDTHSIDCPARPRLWTPAMEKRCHETCVDSAVDSAPARREPVQVYKRKSPVLGPDECEIADCLCAEAK